MDLEDSKGGERRYAASRWDGILCSAGVMLAILAIRPFVEMGLIDDFSYVKTTFDYARTGHFIYNGWATAMLGWQVLWGSLFVKLFGFTFQSARLSVLAIGAVSLVIIHAILIRCGLTRVNAIFGTLAVGFCPIFVALSITFMTDVSGLLIIVACLYCSLRALSAQTDRAMFLWLLAGNAIGVIGGTARQIAWLTVLVMMPCAAWLLRKRRGVPALAIALWIIDVALVKLSLWWFKHQLFNVPEPLIQGTLNLRSLRELAGTMLAAGLCLVLLLMPLLSAGVTILPKLRAKTIAGVLAMALVGTWICRFITFHLTEKGFMPWTGDIVDKMGVFDFSNAWFLGVSPTTFNHTGRVLASILVLITAILFVYKLSDSRETLVKQEFRVSWQSLAVLLGPFTCSYVLLLVPRGIWAQILDRYLLPLVMLGLLVLLRLYQERISLRLPAISWVVLAVFSVYILMSSHDWIESHRARLSAVKRLNAEGIPDDRVAAGYEFDGMTQIKEGRAIIDPRVTFPPDMDVRPYFPEDLKPECKYLFNPHTPVVRAEYFLAYQVVPCLTVTRFGSERYRTWLPPFEREIFILQQKK